VIDCAFDESGSKESPRGDLLVVSSYIGATSRMKRLSRSWQTTLDEFGLPYFHTKELWNGKSKLFKGLSKTQRKRLLSALIESVHYNVQWGFSAFIYPDYYVSKTSERFRSQWGSPYTFAMRLTILLLILILERDKRAGEAVNIMIEEGHRNASQALEMIREFSAFEDRPLNIRNYGLGPKKGQPALQAADMLAYASCEDFCTKSRLMDRLVAKESVTHFWINCNTEVVEMMQDTVRSYYTRRKAEWLEKSRRPLT
jgi:hypothetical protein